MNELRWSGPGVGVIIAVRTLEECMKKYHEWQSDSHTSRTIKLFMVSYVVYCITILFNHTLVIPCMLLLFIVSFLRFVLLNKQQDNNHSNDTNEAKVSSWNSTRDTVMTIFIYSIFTSILAFVVGISCTTTLDHYISDDTKQLINLGSRGTVFLICTRGVEETIKKWNDWYPEQRVRNFMLIFMTSSMLCAITSLYYWYSCLVQGVLSMIILMIYQHIIMVKN